MGGGGVIFNPKNYIALMNDDHAIMRESVSLVQNTLFIDYSDILLAL